MFKFIFVETIAKIKLFLNNASKVKNKIKVIQKTLSAEALESLKREEVQKFDKGRSTKLN